MSINSTIQVIIKQIRNCPKKINKVGSALELLLNCHHTQISFQVLYELRDVLTLYLKNIESKAVHCFLAKKIVLYGDIVLHFLFQTPKEQVVKYFELLNDFFSIGEGRKQIMEKIVQKIKEGSFQEWEKLTNSQLITQICIVLRKQPLYNQNIILFLNSLPHFHHLDFQYNSIQLENSSQENQKALKKHYEALVIHFLVLVQEQDKSLQVKMYRKLGQKMLSKFVNPLMLAEYLIEKFQDQYEEPEIQIQVLSSLFILVGKYGLQMDKFYTKLEIMMKKGRHFSNSLYKLSNSKRFIKLIESAMRSSRVPFKTILSLVKIFISQIFQEESEFAFWALSFLVNLVKKHRQLQKHLSELPEIQALKYHSSSRIRSLVGELNKNLNKAEYLDIEQFGKVNCGKICEHQLMALNEKIDDNEGQIEFRI